MERWTNEDGIQKLFEIFLASQKLILNSLDLSWDAVHPVSVLPDDGAVQGKKSYDVPGGGQHRMF